MAIANTIDRVSVQGDVRVVYGKSVLSGGTNTGDIATGLNRIDSFQVITKDTTAKAVAVDEDFPLAGGDVTFYSEDNDATVYWKAEGK